MCMCVCACVQCSQERICAGETIAAQVGLDMLMGLSSIHSFGIIHRDIKPGNVLLFPDGRAKLADFGQSRIEEPGGCMTPTVSARWQVQWRE